MTQRSICFLPFPSWRRTSCFAVYRNDSPLALQQMPEPQDRSLFVLDVVRCGHHNVRVAQHLARGRQAVAGVIWLSYSLRSAWSGVFERTPFERSHTISSWMSLWQR